MTVPSGADRAIANMEGVAALPRKNGELVFEAPWEGRAFALAVALHEQDSYVWDDFRRCLITEIAAAEVGGTPSTYYDRWLAALETVILSEGLLRKEDLEARTAEFASGDREDVF